MNAKSGKKPEVKPVVTTAQTKEAEVKPAETKEAEVKAAETKTLEAKAAEVKAAASAVEAKATEKLANVKETVKETSTDKKIELGIKVLLANKIVRISLIVCAILFVYEIIVRWIIYKKAGRHGWAAIVPIYRQITMYKVSGLSPWLILLILIPIIGAFIIAIIEIIQKFKLSKKFGKGVLFGFGLLFLQPIFESIIAFSKKIKYKG